MFGQVQETQYDLRFSLLRIPVANIIAIMAGRRALFAYVRTLRGADVSWDKTTHRSHPASFATKAIAR